MAPISAPADTGGDLHIQLLGGFRLQLGPRTVDEAAFRLRKASALVKLLALAPDRRLHRDQLCDLLWTDLTSEAAANNLRYALHVARRGLDELAPSASGALRREGDWLTLHPPGNLRVDVDAFESAASAARRSRDPGEYHAAVELYGGDLLPDDRYEDWAAARRSELRSLYLGLLAELARLHEARGNRAAALETWQHLVKAEPLDEGAHLALVRLYAQTGRRQRALQQYRLLKNVLRRELDAEPDAESERVYQQILGDGSAGRAAVPTDQFRHNLPSPLTSFIGRVREIAEITHVLQQSGGPRLLTLIGTGGCGKTRLALELAARVGDEYSDGVWLVELAGLADPGLLPQKVAAALGVPEAPGAHALTTLTNFLRYKRLLLLLDNCEHLAKASAELVDALLRACPHLQVLATSRQALDVAGEAVWPVAGLSVPSPASLAPSVRPRADVPGSQLEAPSSELLTYDAVRLFVGRARLSRPDFAVTSQGEALAVAHICQRLDGLPLAIELAAARLKVLSVEQVAARLDHRFELLTGGGSTTLPRHRTLRGVVDWSYSLLSQEERLLFNGLSVFAGGFTLEAAQEVCAAVLDLLSGLVDKSLVVVESGAGGAPRYRLLETLRQYARERLDENGEAETTRRRHAAYFLALAEQAESGVFGAEQLRWLERLQQEYDNIRATLGWCLEHDAQTGLRLAGALWGFWVVRGSFSEGRRWLEGLLARHQGRGAAHARALFAAGDFATRQGDASAARARLEASLALYRDLGDRGGTSWALRHLATLARTQGDYARARALYEDALAVFREVQDHRGVSWTQIALGRVARAQGDYGQAQALLDESLALEREYGTEILQGIALAELGRLALLQGDYDRSAALLEQSVCLLRETGHGWELGWAVRQQANSALCQGKPDVAEALLRESLAVFREIGDEVRVSDCLRFAGVLAVRKGQDLRGVQLIAAASAFPGSVGVPLEPNERTECEPSLATARTALGERAFAAAWAEGQATTLDQAIACALAWTEVEDPGEDACTRT